MELDLKNIPSHVAIILDGNGRWAKARGKKRTYGHCKGIYNIYDTTISAMKLGIKYLTVFCFSTENWKRDEAEVKYLMHAPIHFFNQYGKRINEDNIRINVIGRKDRIPTNLNMLLNNVIDQTKNNTGITLTLCFDYGAYDEITTAVKNIATEIKNNNIDIKDITPELIENNLFTSGYPKLDLLIRTSGEIRISNFLLWQLAYAELYFTDVFWPDFNEDELIKALIDYQNRNRRFGGVKK